MGCVHEKKNCVAQVKRQMLVHIPNVQTDCVDIQEEQEKLLLCG